MSTYFPDTSALIKRYIAEKGHSWIRSLYATNPKPILVISQITLTECVTTICRKAREQSISINERDAIIDVFLRHRQRLYQMVPVTNAICIEAGTLCKTHRLRAYDAIQLASVLTYRKLSLTDQRTVPIFISADNQLLAVASSEGLATENPNNYE